MIEVVSCEDTFLRPCTASSETTSLERKLCSQGLGRRNENTYSKEEILVITGEEYLAAWMSWERYSNSRRVFKSLMKKYCKSIGTSVVSESSWINY